MSFHGLIWDLLRVASAENTSLAAQFTSYSCSVERTACPRKSNALILPHKSQPSFSTVLDKHRHDSKNTISYVLLLLSRMTPAASLRASRKHSRAGTRTRYIQKIFLASTWTFQVDGNIRTLFSSFCTASRPLQNPCQTISLRFWEKASLEPHPKLPTDVCAN